jgi:hypothetical protein
MTDGDGTIRPGSMDSTAFRKILTPAAVPFAFACAYIMRGPAGECGAPRKNGTFAAHLTIA